ncbi:MAG: EFR1 family ferrodoxin [Clostridia bacterium]|nr:EFR1 family ferrodoxin [Clostridia bacterium]
MILYFSGTGNTEYVAKRISAVTGEQLLSIPKLLDSKRFHLRLTEDGRPALSRNFSSPVLQGEELEPEHREGLPLSVGIATPVYFTGLPSVVSDFLKKFHVNGPSEVYVYLILTYGGSPGSVTPQAAQLLASRGVKLSAAFSVKMPENWAVNFNPSPEQDRAVLEEAEPQIDLLSRMVESRLEGDYAYSCMPPQMSALFHRIYEPARLTKHLHAEDFCIGCGICAASCPVHAIKMEDHRPVWRVPKCAMCLGCFHRCPINAIGYRGMTEGKRQYMNPHADFYGNRRQPDPEGSRPDPEAGNRG